MRLFEGTEFYQPPRCARCNELEESCQCPPPQPEADAPEDQTATIRIEKRKKGKIVTVVAGLSSGTPEPHFSELLTRMKNSCGAGGSVKDGSLEIQGDHLERLVRMLKKIGYQVRV